MRRLRPPRGASVPPPVGGGPLCSTLAPDGLMESPAPPPHTCGSSADVISASPPSLCPDIWGTQGWDICPRTHALTHSHTQACARTCTHTHTHSKRLTDALAHKHTHMHAHSHTQRHPYNNTNTHSDSHTHTHTHNSRPCCVA